MSRPLGDWRRPFMGRRKPPVTVGTSWTATHASPPRPNQSTLDTLRSIQCNGGNVSRYPMVELSQCHGHMAANLLPPTEIQRRLIVIRLGDNLIRSRSTDLPGAIPWLPLGASRSALLPNSIGIVRVQPWRMHRFA